MGPRTARWVEGAHSALAGKLLRKFQNRGNLIYDEVSEGRGMLLLHRDKGAPGWSEPNRFFAAEALAPFQLISANVVSFQPCLLASRSLSCLRPAPYGAGLRRQVSVPGC